MARRVLFDFQCPGCGIIFEDFIFDFEDKSKCPNCGNLEAKKLISAPHIGWRIMGVDPDFPTASGKWTKMQWQKSRIEKEANEAEGQPRLK